MGRRDLNYDGINEEDIIEDRPRRPMRLAPDEGEDYELIEADRLANGGRKKLTPEQRYPNWDWEHAPWGPPLEPLPLSPGVITFKR